MFGLNDVKHDLQWCAKQCHPTDAAFCKENDILKKIKNLLIKLKQITYKVENLRIFWNAKHNQQTTIWKRLLWSELNGKEMAIEETYKKAVFWKNIYTLKRCIFKELHIMGD